MVVANVNKIHQPEKNVPLEVDKFIHEKTYISPSFLAYKKYCFLFPHTRNLISSAVETFIYLISFLINFYIYNFIKIKYCSYVCALKLYVWCVKC